MIQTVSVSHPTFSGHAIVDVVYDNSGDRDTPDAPPQVDIIEVTGDYQPHDDADFEPATFDGGSCPPHLIDRIMSSV